MEDSEIGPWRPQPSCHTFHAWREHGIFPVEWYNPAQPGPGPDRYFSAFLDSFWRYMLETPKQREVYQHYQYYEMDYDLTADFVYSKPLEQIHRFLQSAGGGLGQATGEARVRSHVLSQPLGRVREGGVKGSC